MIHHRARDLIIAMDMEGAREEIERISGQVPEFVELTLRAGLAMRQRRFEEAMVSLDRAVGLNRVDATVHYNRGLCLYELGRFAEAAAEYRMVLKIDPGMGIAWLKLGGSYLAQHVWPEALACYERAVLLEPDNAEFHLGYATYFSLTGDDVAAERCYRRSLALKHTLDAELGLSLVLLRSGQWREGFRLFGSRLNSRPYDAPWDYVPREYWCGAAEGLRGKRVLVRSEQGFGDTIHFSRYLPLVADFAEVVVFEVQPSLARLMKAGLPERVTVVEPGWQLASGGFDVEVPLMSLPAAFGTTVEACPPALDFKVARKSVDVRVGVCWHGDARPADHIANSDDARRSVRWEEFLPVASVVPCQSLQREDLGDCGDWADTAGVIKALDLVITVDTAVAHLAASLGVETWLLARRGGCWRWLQERADTPWYPSMYIYRQDVMTEWGPTIAAVVDDLRAWAANR